MTQQNTILLVDDNPMNLQVLLQSIMKLDARCVLANNGTSALELITSNPPDLILLDVNMPDIDGFEVCRRVKANPETSHICVIFLTALNQVEDKVKGFDVGAVDFITKPFQSAEIIARVKTQLTILNLRNETERKNLELKKQVDVAVDMLQDAKTKQNGPLLGSSAAITTLKANIIQAATHQEPVLINTLPGCGEEFVARTIHDQSERNHNPFIYVNCSLINATNSATIFDDTEGHVSKLNLASNGTLYLDRINEMPLSAQNTFIDKILSFLSKNIRLICVSTEALGPMVHQQSFSPELHDFISKHELLLPTLSERIDDIPVLAEHYVKYYSSRHSKNINSLSESSLETLQDYKWPGNLSEFISVIESRVVTCNDSILEIPPDALNKGPNIGGYHLITKLDEGGMGEIWQAEHRLLARPAAIKLIHANGLSSEESLARFFREAKAIAMLNSTHTINLYDFGIQKNGALFYVMELLQGMDLLKLVKKYGPIPYQRALQFLHHSAISLLEAHEMGLIHRDIKPGNIFVCNMGNQPDYVKLLDFGIAKDTNALDNEELTGQKIIGTPAYMAPEAFMPENTTESSIDLYALACVAYWMLAGKTLFECNSPISYFSAHSHSDPTPIRDFIPDLDVPEKFENLLLSCLAKVPGKRPSTKEFLVTMMELCKEYPWEYDQAVDWWSQHNSAE